MVNTPDDMWSVESIKQFAQNITKNENNKPQPSLTKVTGENSSPSTPREKSFSALKSQQASLEAEFVLNSRYRWRRKIQRLIL